MSDPTRKPPIRVCHLISPGLMGGAEKVVLAGCQALRKRGVEAVIGVIRETRAPHMADCFVTEATQRGLPAPKEFATSKRIDFQLYRSLRRHLHESGFDVLHTHGNKAILYGVRARPRSTRLVHTQHGETAHRFAVRLYAWLAAKHLRNADAVCAVSKEMYSRMTRDRLAEDKVWLVENMLSMEPPYPVRKPSQGRLRLVLVGRLSPEKGIDILLNAIAKLDAQPVRLTILGEGPIQGELDSLVSSLGLQKIVDFVGFQRDIKPYLEDADAFVMPSLREGFPMSLIEAAACGLPVIASRVGGIPDLVNHGENGLLCDPNDTDALVNILAEYIQSPERYAATAQAMGESIRTRFSAATWAERTESLYETLV